MHPRAPEPGRAQPCPCPLHDTPSGESRGPACPPGSQTVHCPRAAATRGGHHNNMQSAARGRPPRRSRCPRRPSPQHRAPSSGTRITVHGAEGARGPGPNGLSASPTGGGVSPDTPSCLRRWCLGPGPYSPSLTQGAQGSRARVPHPPPVWTRIQSPSAAPRGARSSHSPCLPGAGPTPLLPRPPSSAGKAHLGGLCDTPRALGGGAPLPRRLLPRPPNRPRRPKRPRVPQRAPEPPDCPHSGIRAPGGHPARSTRRPPPSSPGRRSRDSPQYHQLPVFHRLLIGGAVLLLAGGKHGAPIGRRRRLLRRRDPRRVRAAATIPS